MIKNYKKAYRNRIDENSITPQQEDSHVDKSHINRPIKTNRVFTTDYYSIFYR